MVNGIDINTMSFNWPLIVSDCNPNKIIIVNNRPMIDKGLEKLINVLNFSSLVRTINFLVVTPANRGIKIYKTTDAKRIDHGTYMLFSLRRIPAIGANAKIIIKLFTDT